MFGEMTIIGRVGGDPEMRFTPQGKAVTNLSVAVDQGYGENKKTLWVKVTAWGNNDGTGGKAEAAANYLHKGSLVFAKGEPSVRAYIHTDGEARASLELNAREIKFLDPKPQDGNGNGQQARPAQQPRPATQTPLAGVAATAATGYAQVSPDGKYGWDGKAWVAIPPPPPGTPAPTVIPPPPAPADATARDVDPDDIPF